MTGARELRSLIVEVFDLVAPAVDIAPRRQQFEADHFTWLTRA